MMATSVYMHDCIVTYTKSFGHVIELASCSAADHSSSTPHFVGKAETAKADDDGQGEMSISCATRWPCA
jgi:hypothetical protein